MGFHDGFPLGWGSTRSQGWVIMVGLKVQTGRETKPGIDQ